MDKSLKNNAHLFNYLVEEFTNSGDHYRHLEQQRSQYIAFYLTFLVGTIGFSISILKDQSFSELNLISITGISFIFLINSIIGSVLLGAVKKLGYALSRHIKKMNWIRQKMTVDENFDHNDMCGSFDDSHTSFGSKIFSTQLAIEYILIFLSIILCVAYFLIYFFSYKIGSINITTFLITQVPLLILFIYIIKILLSNIRAPL